ncbi:MAG: DNA mismatch repair protein MutS, partial [Chlamydiota bacterium]|nr:DNA mismatch repair protein MutS [Chlamydiota bacterium]
GKGRTLFSLLDQTGTPMGSRLLQRWITHPLLSPNEIVKRQESIQSLLDHPRWRQDLQHHLRKIHDVERTLQRVMRGQAGPREFLKLITSLDRVIQVMASIEGGPSETLRVLLPSSHSLSPLVEEVRAAIVEDPPIKVEEGSLFRLGHHPDLDRMIQEREEHRQHLLRYQEKLSTDWGIRSAKVTYHKVFGYCIEVSRSQARNLPGYFERRQTLANVERFTTETLKGHEAAILAADAAIKEREDQLYRELYQRVADHKESIRTASEAIATIDLLTGLAEVAERRHYCRPIIHSREEITIREGRHPVIESVLPPHAFIPNDVHLDEKEARMMLITGPNMAGKSTYIRQVALIVLMAQMGSFVPASAATIGIVDRLFSRIGASDDLSQGESTFMVEMKETAHILNHATPRSLIVLDEIGRGTSTYDGIAIAWSVAEALAKRGQHGIKTLFATHYKELAALNQSLPHVRPFCVAVETEGPEILFLHKILAGISHRSYGVHVARLAGLPPGVIARAEHVLRGLENASWESPPVEVPCLEAPPPAFIKTLQSLDLEAIRPIDALNYLIEWQQELTKEPLEDPLVTTSSL